LKDNYEVRISKFRVLRVPPIQIPTLNEKMKILFSHPWCPETKQNNQNC
jgi:hypothetical protein